MTAALPHGRRARLGGRGIDSRSTDVLDQLTVVIAHVAVLAAGTNLALVNGLTVGLVLGIGLLPLWLPALRRFELAIPIAVLAVVAVPAGLFLAYLSSVDHDIDPTKRTGSVVLLLSGVVTMAIILWARRMMPLHRIVLLFGVGALVTELAIGPATWKYDLAVPVTLVALGAAEHARNRLLPALVISGLGVFGVIHDSRSYFAFCMLAATLTIWQMRPRPDPDRAPNRRFAAILLVGLAVSAYFLFSSMLTMGVFGPELQARSVAQIQSSGSLIAGGRPEWSATRELMRMNPLGYGLGVVPSWTDLEAGTSGLTRINVDAGGYANNYMFGGEFNLHSISADLWVSYGVVGLALAGVIVWALFHSLVTLLASRRASTAVVFTSVIAIWFMFFGPIYSNWRDVCLALGLVLLSRAPEEPASAPDTR